VIRRFASALAGIVALTSCLALAADVSPKPQGPEVAFVQGVQKDLSARFATPAQAVAAGYFRFTNEDKTGSISYANLQWQSADPAHPSQLWYSAKGVLLGADYSVLKSASPKPPALWGVLPDRWGSMGAHVHYVLIDANGKETYGATSLAKFKAAGGDPKHPQAAAIVKMGIAKNAAQVKRVFEFPAIWDLQVWVLPNPNGAFAEMNPNVKPSSKASNDSM
jgi:hypothetical protein